MKKQGSMNVAPLLTKLRAAPHLLRQTLSAELEKQGRLLVSSSGKVRGIVQATPPYNLEENTGTRAAKEAGNVAVRRDIYRVYGSPGKLYFLIKDKDVRTAARYFRLLKAGRMGEASKVAQEAVNHRLRPFDGGRAHKARRDRRGRVRGMKQSIYVHDEAALSAYISMRQKRVGMLAASLVDAAESELGRLSGVPAFVRRHSVRWGTVDKRQSAGGERVTANLSAPYATANIRGLFFSVQQFRKRAFDRELPYILRNRLRKLL
jgi:hypothetical protein